MTLQTTVLVFVTCSWLLWFSCVCLYIPYVLFLAPSVVADADTGARAPGEDFGAGRVAAVVAVSALFCDSLLLAGIYQKYKGIHRADMGMGTFSRSVFFLKKQGVLRKKNE